MSEERSNTVDFIGRQSATLSLIELGLGSVVHALNIPMGGQFLSLYQIFFMAKSSVESRPFDLEKKSPYLISNIAAILKSLSPAGNRLGPMLSIAIQGLLFSFGIFAFGATTFGYLIGAVVSGLWAFAQPLLTYFIFFGSDLFKAIDYFVKKTIPFSTAFVITAVVSVVVLKICGSIAAVITALYFHDHTKVKAFEKKLFSVGAQKFEVQNQKPLQTLSVLRGVLRDMTRPLFVLSILMTGAFFFYSQQDGTRVWIYLLRPLAIAFIFFYFSRSLILLKLISKLEAKSLSPWIQSLRQAFEQLARKAS